MGQREIPHRQAVYQAMIGAWVQGLHGAAHRQVTRPQDVEPIDFLTRGGGHGPHHRWILGQEIIKPLAFGRAEFLGIIQAGAFITRRQHHRRRRHRPGQGPPARLIHARDPLHTAGLKRAFEGQVGHGSELVEALACRHL